MSQLVACVSEKFALVAADRRVEVREESGTRVLSLKKLYAPSRTALLATSGAAVGISISERFEHTMQARDSLNFGEVADFAASFFQKEYDEFIRKGAAWFKANPEAMRLAYLLLAGRNVDGTFGLRFYASESHTQPFKMLPTGAVLTAPRRIGLEAALMKTLAASPNPDEIKMTVLKALTRIEAVDGAVAGPFDVSVITVDGLKMETIEKI